MKVKNCAYYVFLLIICLNQQAYTQSEYSKYLDLKPKQQEEFTQFHKIDSENFIILGSGTCGSPRHFCFDYAKIDTFRKYKIKNDRQFASWKKICL